MSVPRKLPTNSGSEWLAGAMWDHVEGCLEPLSEIQETELEIILRVDIPCVKRKEDISVKLTEDSATIEAEMEKVIQYEKWGTFQRQARFFRYSKTFVLPSKIDPEFSKARFKNKVLELRLPKKERRFTVNVD